MTQGKDAGDADALMAIFRELGAENPKTWADSELRENIPQLARFCLLRRLWRSGIDPWRDGSALGENPVISDRLRRILASGLSLSDAAYLAASVAYMTTFDLLMAIDEGTDPDGSTELPGWRLMETNRDGRLTGRVVGSLHESLIETDPSGMQARDLLGESV